LQGKGGTTEREKVEELLNEMPNVIFI